MSSNAKNNKESLQKFGETYYKDFDQIYDRYIEETAKETFGQYYKQEKNWFAIKEKAIRDYQSDELS